METILKGQAYLVQTVVRNNATIGLFCPDHARAYLGSPLFTVDELDGVELCFIEERTERAATCKHCGISLI
jgi:hypothetical protein